MKKVLMILAHPDDEILWGWPILQMGDTEVSLLTITNNSQTYEGRAEAALRTVCRDFGINLIDCLPFSSGFYRLPPRHEQGGRVLTNIAAVINFSIQTAVRMVEPDVVFTHNPVGEYGHGDHKLLFELVCSHPAVHNVLVTDICMKNKSHISYDEMPKHITDAYYQLENEVYFWLERNVDPFNSMMEIYQTHRAWSWNNPVPDECGIYKINC